MIAATPTQRPPVERPAGGTSQPACDRSIPFATVVSR